MRAQRPPASAQVHPGPAPPHPWQQLPHLDPGTLQSWRASLPADKVAEIYRAFVAQTGQRLQLLGRAAQGKNPAALSAAAHAIAGSAGMLGAKRLEAGCRDARARIAAGNAPLAELVAELQAAYAELVAHLREQGLAA